MKKIWAFRPRVRDELEDRLVPSSVAVASKPAVVHPHAPLSAQAVATDKLSNAYSTFVTNFTEAVNVDLYAPSVTGFSSNIPFFNQQLGQQLNALTQVTVKTLGPQPTGSPVVSQVRQAINGSSSTSLRSRLTALTLSSMEVGSAISSYEGAAVKAIQQNYVHVKKMVLAALPANSTASGATS